MGVAAADQADRIGVDPDPLLLHQTLDERIADEVEARLTALAHQRTRAGAAVAVVGLLQPADLLVVAQLVFAAHHSSEPVAALRVAFDLGDLDERLDSRAQFCSAAPLFGRHTVVVDREQAPVR